MRIKTIPAKDLFKADKLQQTILNPKRTKRYRTFNYIKKHYALHPDLFVGCYDKDKLIGIAFGYLKKNVVLLGEMAVSKAYAGKGIGKKLLSVFEKRAKIFAKKIILGSRSEAEKFYLKCGYKPLLFLQIKKDLCPHNYKKLGYIIIKETNYKDAKRLYLNIKYDQKLKNKAHKEFNAYDSLYIFEKEL